MKKFTKVFIVLSIAGAVGITYLANSLKGLQDIFDIGGEDGEDNSEF